MPYSAIIVGAGHNGLVAANYLARAGASVLVLERRDFVGGACITEELFPDFRVSSCSYICHMLQGKVIDDLELRKHGLGIHPVDPYRFQPFPSGNYMLRWHDEKHNAEELARLSPPDLDGYHRFQQFMARAAGIIHRYFLDEPPTLAQVTADVQGTADEQVWERMLTGNMRDLVEEHFESPEVRAVFIDTEDAQDPRAPGSIMSVAYNDTDMFTEPHNFGIPHGGMGGITQAMARAAESHGAEIRTNAPVDRIVVRDGRAVGVRLTDGEVIEADVVLSNADPKRTFLSLIDEGDLASDLVSGVRRLKTDVSYLKFHAALDELPDFTGYLGGRYDENYLVQVRICPSVEYFQQSADDARARSALYGASHAHPDTVGAGQDAHTGGQARNVDLGAVRAGQTVRRVLGQLSRAGRRAADRQDLRVRARIPAVGTRLGAVHAAGVGGACRTDRRQHPPPGHHIGADDVQQAKLAYGRVPDPCGQPIPLRRGNPPRRRGHRGPGAQRGTRSAKGLGGSVGPFILSQI